MNELVLQVIKYFILNYLSVSVVYTVLDYLSPPLSLLEPSCYNTVQKLFWFEIMANFVQRLGKN